MTSLLLLAVVASIEPSLVEVVAPPPHVLRIDGVQALVRLPDGSRSVLPVGAEIHAEHYRYRLDSRVTDVAPIDEREVFRSGFESSVEFTP